MKPPLAAALLLLWPMLVHTQTQPQAQTLYQYPEADLVLGQKLLQEHDCVACHVRRVGGDGSSIYRPTGRINTPSALVTMVEVCNTELRLQMFPEDVVSVAAVLQRDHYRFLVSLPTGKASRP